LRNIAVLDGTNQFHNISAISNASLYQTANLLNASCNLRRGKLPKSTFFYTGIRALEKH